MVPPALPPSAVAAIVATPPVGKAVMAAAQVALTAGQQFTFGQEGFRAAPYHPTSGSGVTIGVGYDMSQRSATSIVNDLVAAGVDKNTAQKLAKAAGLTGSAADVFVRQNLGLTITEAQGKALFVSIYNGKADYAQSLATKADVVKLYGPTDWAKLNQRIKDILVDMTYRGDYTPQARTIIQKYLVKNDLAGFRTAMANRANWPDVPKARFDARVAYLRA
ncbi:MAG: pesticin C-terminus-like muramidase [Planctomycetota bacterium]|nr:pesticin C-terminus-like muramidase [Planctomycetota bacterium]